MPIARMSLRSPARWRESWQTTGLPCFLNKELMRLCFRHGYKTNILKIGAVNFACQPSRMRSGLCCKAKSVPYRDEAMTHLSHICLRPTCAASDNLNTSVAICSHPFSAVWSLVEIHNCRTCLCGSWSSHFAMHHIDAQNNISTLVLCWAAQQDTPCPVSLGSWTEHSLPALVHYLLMTLVPCLQLPTLMSAI